MFITSGQSQKLARIFSTTPDVSPTPNFTFMLHPSDKGLRLITYVDGIAVSEHLIFLCGDHEYFTGARWAAEFNLDKS